MRQRQMAFLILLLVTGWSTNSAFAQQGCCSGHGGVRGCQANGRVLCADGWLGSICSCTPSGGGSGGGETGNPGSGGGSVITLIPDDRIVTIPPVIGIDLGEAIAQLAEAGLTVNVVHQSAQPGTSPGKVLAQYPFHGQAPGATTVLLSISAPAEATHTVQVPRLVGMSAADAMITLRATGLELGAMGHCYSNQSSLNTVITQSPEAGLSRQAGVDVVHLTLALPVAETGLRQQVRLLYQRLLYRNATEAEITAGVGQLNNGMTTREFIVNVLTSDEFTTTLMPIHRFFHTLPGRSAFPAEIDAVLTTGFAAVLPSVLATPPWWGLTDAAFVHRLYQHVLWYEPDSEGKTYWVSVLTSQPREAVALAFTEATPRGTHQAYIAAIYGLGLLVPTQIDHLMMASRSIADIIDEVLRSQAVIETGLIPANCR